jgi:NADPH:quinone reductase-like Zn-dependent oxidoreductase
MRAMGIEEFGDPGSIKRLDLPDPPVGPDYVLIRVKAAGVNPSHCSLPARRDRSHAHRRGGAAGRPRPAAGC